jgi:hypothetical protein
MNTVEGRDVYDRVDVYVIHGISELGEVEVDSGSSC